MKGPLLPIVLIFSAFFLTTGSSCISPPPADAGNADSTKWNVDSNLVSKDSLVNGILGNTYDTQSIDSTDYVIIPLVAPLIDLDGERESTFYSSGSYKENSSAYWNLIFYNTATRQSHLLDTARQFVTQYHINNTLRHGSYAGKLIFYDIRRKDFNGNNKLDYADPRYLYCSDLSGRNLRLLSPVNADVLSWEFPKKSDFLLLKIRYDQNRDARFDGKDATSWIRVDLDSTVRQAPLFDPGFEADMKQLFKKQHTKPTP